MCVDRLDVSTIDSVVGSTGEKQLELQATVAPTPPCSPVASWIVEVDGQAVARYPTPPLSPAQRRHVLRSKTNGERGWLAKMLVLGWLGVAASQELSTQDFVAEFGFGLGLPSWLYTVLSYALTPVAFQFQFFRFLWDHIPWWSVLPAFVIFAFLQYVLFATIVWVTYGNARLLLGFYEPRLRAWRVVRFCLAVYTKFFRLFVRPVKLVYETAEPVMKDGHWWLPAEGGRQLLRISPTTMQLLASSAPPKSVLEAHMPQSVVIRTISPVQQAQVQAFIGSNWVPVGECLRVSWKGCNTDSQRYLVLPTHVLQVASRDFQIVRGDCVVPLDITCLRSDKRLVFASTVNNFDVVVFEMPESFFSQLGMKAARLSLYQVGATRVYGRMGESYSMSTGSLTVARRTHRINHTASTEPGWSGAGVWQFNCLVGMHQGYTPESDFERCGFNRALDLYSVFRDVLGLPEITQRQAPIVETPYQLREHFNRLRDDEADEHVDNTERFDEWEQETILLSRDGKLDLLTYGEKAKRYFLEDYNDTFDMREYNEREKFAAEYIADQGLDPFDLNLDIIDEAYRYARDQPLGFWRKSQGETKESGPKASAPEAPARRNTQGSTFRTPRKPAPSDAAMSDSKQPDPPQTSHNVVIQPRAITTEAAHTVVAPDVATQSVALTSTQSCGSVTTIGGPAHTQPKVSALPKPVAQTSGSPTQQPQSAKVSRAARRRNSKKASPVTAGLHEVQPENESAYSSSTRPFDVAGSGPKGKFVISENGHINFIPSEFLPEGSEKKFLLFTTKRDAEAFQARRKDQRIKELEEQLSALSQQGSACSVSFPSSQSATSSSMMSSGIALQAVPMSALAQVSGPMPTSSQVSARS
nr:MAG: hypothetical protein [Sobelivirales sp.]